MSGWLVTGRGTALATGITESSGLVFSEGVVLKEGSVLSEGGAGAPTTSAAQAAPTGESRK